MVEFGLVALLLFTLLFGVIEFGITFNNYQSIRQGVREGAREAVVANYSGSSSCSLNGPAATAIEDVRKVLCLTKERTGIGNDVRVALRVTDNAPANSFRNNSVTVCAVRLAESVTGLLSPFIDGRPLRSKITMRAERSMGPVIDAGNTSSWNETDPTGENWAWC